MRKTEDLITELDENAPREYKCPITLSIMRDPVIMPDGQTYERHAIQRALEINHTSPVTRQQMNIESAVPNYGLKSLIEKYVQNYKQKNNIKPNERFDLMKKEENTFNKRQTKRIKQQNIHRNVEQTNNRFNFSSFISQIIIKLKSSLYSIKKKISPMPKTITLILIILQIIFCFILLLLLTAILYDPDLRKEFEQFTNDVSQKLYFIDIMSFPFSILGIIFSSFGIPFTILKKLFDMNRVIGIFLFPLFIVIFLFSIPIFLCCMIAFLFFMVITFMIFAILFIPIFLVKLPIFIKSSIISGKISFSKFFFFPIKKLYAFFMNYFQ